MCTDEAAPLPSLVARRAIVLFLTDAGAEHETKSTAFLDHVARHGCSAGVAASSGDDADNEAAVEDAALRSFLGLAGAGASPSLMQYHVPHVLLTTKASMASDVRDGALYEHVALDDLPARTRAAASEPSRNLTLVYMDRADYTPALDATLLQLVQEQPTTFFGVLQETPTLRLPSDRRFEARTLFPLPKQSWAKVHNSYRTDAVESQRALAYAFYARDQVRPDTLERFDPASMLAHGGYGILQAHAALQEIAFRLGYAPKYGA
ncbi:hypothetical protein SPRG_12830 [Saprolegnia parasitica CBS 223.65]|uniref:Uncharacterized protein n=1 Tax=Saprolegnia parasitica (strain CBS 223.65) TaxID=695850 RepID=A0A067BTU1_SAPPC|nr:hypothetical protein SPRG_12830 [Saprolegnia parasitica CBS 223.65]KDO21964.1 hypothetical protein SPRG_12830 [Saprolegnia parasitica CBS 223.65]|eukprot:XP_012207306.1 hypothetical protein SPRG_12830 [Saprolegnia parasitica CBS 223.65]